MSETNTTTETVEETKPEAPAGPVVPAPFARITGRLILPDGTPATGATLTLDPLPCKVSARLADGPALIGSRVRTTLDEHGRVASKAGEFVDVIGCGEGVSPSGSWAYMVRLTGAGVDWRGVAILRAGTTTDLTDILAGLAAPTGGGAVDDAALKALAEKLDKLHDELHGKHWQGVENDFRDDGVHIVMGPFVPFREAFDVSMSTVQTYLEDTVGLSERVDTIDAAVTALEDIPKRVKIIEDEYVTEDGMAGGLWGNFPYVQRSQGKPAEQYGATSISESFGALARTVIAVDKDLHTIKAGPYPYYQDNDGDGVKERLDFTREQWIETVAKDVRDIAAIAESKATAVVNEQMPQHVGDLAEAYTQLEGQLAALEARLPREQTAWTKLTDIPANLVAAGNGNGVYVRRHGSVVYMAIRGANPAAGLVKFTVPAGYRHSFSMAAMGVLIPADDAKLSGKLQFGHQGAFEWKGTAGVTDLGYGVLSYPTNDPWPES